MGLVHHNFTFRSDSGDVQGNRLPLLSRSKVRGRRARANSFRKYPQFSSRSVGFLIARAFDASDNRGDPPAGDEKNGMLLQTQEEESLNLKLVQFRKQNSLDRSGQGAFSPMNRVGGRDPLVNGAATCHFTGFLINKPSAFMHLPK
jgi:hypothetical protein